MRNVQNERQGDEGKFAVFLVDSIPMQADAGSIRVFLAGAFLASIGVGLVVFSLLGRQEPCRPVVVLHQRLGGQAVAQHHCCHAVTAVKPVWEGAGTFACGP